MAKADADPAGVIAHLPSQSDAASCHPFRQLVALSQKKPRPKPIVNRKPFYRTSEQAKELRCKVLAMKGPLKEIAKSLGLSEGYVKNMRFRARRD